MLVMLALLFSSLAIPSHIEAKENAITVYKNMPMFHSIGHHNCDMFTNGELNVINHFIQENDIVFDIGANVGNWSEQALRVAPHGKIYAFEPIPSIYQQLKTNLESRGVSVHNCALSDYTGIKTLFFYPHNSELSGLHYRSILKDILQAEPTKIDVSTINLATFCLDNTIDHIDFLKIDTAGAEVEILRSAQSLLSEQKISFVQFEYGGCYKDSKTTLKEAYSLLTSCGYHVFRIIPNGLVEIAEWDDQLENFVYSNYFASIKELKSLPLPKIIYTAALINDKYEMRKDEYIRGIKTLDIYGYKPYIVESCKEPGVTFFDSYSPYVFYAYTNNATLKNKGVNECMSLIAAFKHYNFDDNDMIIKLTGRYYFNSDKFFKAIQDNPNVDAFATRTPWNYDAVCTGCFALRYKYFKEMLSEFDYAKMEQGPIDVEDMVGLYLKKINLNGVKVLYLDSLDLTANVFCTGTPILTYW